MTPVIASLKKHQLVAALVIVQVAISFAACINAAAEILERSHHIGMRTGISEQGLAIVPIRDGGVGSDQLNPRLNDDLARLRNVPGVRSVAAVTSFPLSENNWSYGVCGSSDAVERSIQLGQMADGCVDASAYGGTSDFLKALDVKVSAGEGFSSSDFTVTDPHTAIITTALSNALFHTANPVGHVLHFGPEEVVRVVGVVDSLVGPNVKGEVSDQFVVLWPKLPTGPTTTYLIRSGAGDVDRVVDASRKLLLDSSSSRLYVATDGGSFAAIRSHYFRHDKNVAILVGIFATILLLVTLIGVSALSSYWVQQRYRQIGIFRALGASRTKILAYFQIENALLSCGGLVAGLLLTWGLHRFLSTIFSMPSLSVALITMWMIAFFFIGQLTVISSSIKASKLPPVQILGIS